MCAISGGGQNPVYGGNQAYGPAAFMPPQATGVLEQVADLLDGLASSDAFSASRQDDSWLQAQEQLRQFATKSGGRKAGKYHQAPATDAAKAGKKAAKHAAGPSAPDQGVDRIGKRNIPGSAADQVHAATEPRPGDSPKATKIREGYGNNFDKIQASRAEAEDLLKTLGPGRHKLADGTKAFIREGKDGTVLVRQRNGKDFTHTRYNKNEPDKTEVKWCDETTRTGKGGYVRHQHYRQDGTTLQGVGMYRNTKYYLTEDGRPALRAVDTGLAEEMADHAGGAAGSGNYATTVFNWVANPDGSVSSTKDVHRPGDV